MKVHKDLTKEEMIEVLESLAKRADDFEETRCNEDLLAMAIINVGFYLHPKKYSCH